MCNQHTYKVIVVTDATYWTGEVGSIPRRFLEIFVCFGTGRAPNFPLIPVDVLPREVVEILATQRIHQVEVQICRFSILETCLRAWAP